MSEAYQKTLTVNEDDLDELNHVNNVRYVQWIQDIAKEHWNEFADKSLREGIIWVVKHHDISYKSPAKLGDRINIRTYIEKSKGAVSTRIVEMLDFDTAKVLLRSSTEWCLLDANSLRPIRITEDIKRVFI